MTNQSKPDAFPHYIGGAQFHDACLVRQHIRGTDLDVFIRSEEGRLFKVSFSEVELVKSVHPEGMMLYALVETKPEGALRSFSFVNWDENDEALLDVTARDYRIEETVVSEQA
jgi:hypothetical protein